MMTKEILSTFSFGQYNKQMFQKDATSNSMLRVLADLLIDFEKVKAENVSSSPGGASPLTSLV